MKIIFNYGSIAKLKNFWVLIKNFNQNFFLIFLDSTIEQLLTLNKN